MRVIITGGTGQIGRDLTASLAASGHEVIVLTRSPELATRLAPGVRPVGWDGRTAEGWGHLADGAGAIVNLAGANIAGEGFFPSRWTEARKRILRDSRVNAGRAVVEAVLGAEARPGVVIQASGVGYYGARAEYPVAADSPPGDDFLARLAAEEWEPSTAPVEEMGVRRAIIRSGAVLDADQGALKRMVLPFRLFVGGPMGSGKQWFSWIHQADQVRAIRFLIEQEEARGPFNLTAPQPVTNKEFSRALGRALGRPSWLPLPAFALRLAFGEVSGVLLTGQAALPDRLQELGFEFKYPDVESALREMVG